jgi:TonB family protein
LGGAGVCLVAACGKDSTREIKSLKAQVQDRYGAKDFAKGYELSNKGLTLARAQLGDKHPDTLYFAQGVSSNAVAMHNPRLAMSALKQELDLRSKAGQSEKKLQSRRTLLIQIAEENGDKSTAIDQTVIIAKNIGMGPGKDPQPTYRPENPYPADLARQHIEADVDIAYGLDANGTPVAPRVVRAVPTDAFNIAALENFRRWRFTPYIENGEPTSSSGHRFTLAFRLTKRKAPAADN